MNNLYVLIASIVGFYVGKLMAAVSKDLPKKLLEECGESIDVTNDKVWHLEIFMALLFSLSAWFFPIGPQLIFILCVSCLLICCFITDYEHGILPDQFTLSLVWIGLIGTLYPVLIEPQEAILGAVFGYGFFWLSNVIYRYFRGVEGMYPGDFKLNAGIGACFGFKFLFLILFASSILLLVVTLIRFLFLKKNSKLDFLYQEIPYGCYASVVTIGSLFINHCC